MIPGVAAKAPPEPVCGVCTDALDTAAGDHNVTITRETSTAELYPHENGTTQVTARVTLTTGAAQLQNNTQRRAIVQDVSYIVADRRQQLETAMDGNTLVVTYIAPNMTHMTAGVLRFDAFQTRDPPPFAAGGEGSPYPGADRLVLHAPPGFEIAGSYGTTSNATTVVWTDSGGQSANAQITEDRIISCVSTTDRVPQLRLLLATVIDWVT